MERALCDEARRAVVRIGVLARIWTDPASRQSVLSAVLADAELAGAERLAVGVAASLVGEVARGDVIGIGLVLGRARLLLAEHELEDALSALIAALTNRIAGAAGLDTDTVDLEFAGAEHAVAACRRVATVRS